LEEAKETRDGDERRTKGLAGNDSAAAAEQPYAAAVVAIGRWVLFFRESASGDYWIEESCFLRFLLVL
jgi:hypothetical protein